MNEQDYQDRIRKLEADLARERQDHLLHKKMLMEFALPGVPPTPEEEHRLMTDIGGEPIRKILEELEVELRG